MASILTAKQRKMPPRAQIQTLVRIARRASCKVDWLLGEELSGYFERCATPHDLVCRDRDVAKARARAQQATDEILAICEASDDLDLRRKARAFR